MTTHYRDAAVTLVPVGGASVSGIDYEVWTSPTGSKISDLRDVNGATITKVTSSAAGELFFDDPANSLTAYLKSPTGKFYGTISNEGRDAIPGLVAALVDATITEKIQDVAAGLITGGVLTNLTASYDDPGGKLNLTALGARTYKGSVATQTAMLALTANVGDIVSRSDRGSLFELIATPATAIGNWLEYPGMLASDQAKLAALTPAGALLRFEIWWEDALTGIKAANAWPTVRPPWAYPIDYCGGSLSDLGPTSIMSNSLRDGRDWTFAS